MTSCWTEITTSGWGVNHSMTIEQSETEGIIHLMTGSYWQRGETDLHKAWPGVAVLTLIQHSVCNNDWCFKLDTDSSVFCSAPDHSWLEGNQYGCSLESVIALRFVRHILLLIKANCDSPQHHHHLPHTYTGMHAHTQTQHGWYASLKKHELQASHWALFHFLAALLCL